MRGANMNYPIGLAVPISGAALMTMVTPGDPSNDDWSHATAILRQIVSRKLGGIRLRRVRHALIACPSASSVVM